MVYSQSVRIRNVVLGTSSSVFHTNSYPSIVNFHKGAA